MAVAGRVEWPPTALRDLIEIYPATAADNPRAAREQSEHILERAEALPRHPPPWQGLTLAR